MPPVRCPCAHSRHDHTPYFSSLLGLLNLVRTGSPGAAVRWAALGANILALAFVFGLVPLGSLRQNPQVTSSILLIAAATLFSLLRRETPTA